VRDFHDTEFVVFDVETTGLSPKSGDRIIEIAALKIRGLKPVESFSSLVDPERELSYGAFLVNGISEEMLDGAPAAEDVIPDFLDFAGSACLVGHNIRFDLAFLDYELFRLDRRDSKAYPHVDTLRMSRRLLPGLARYSLQSVARSFGIMRPQQHRAMSDVELTSEIFHRLLHIAGEEGIQDTPSLLRHFGSAP